MHNLIRIMSRTTPKPAFINHSNALEAAKYLNAWFNDMKIAGPTWGKSGMPAAVLQATLDHILVEEECEASLHVKHEVSPRKLQRRLGVDDLGSRTLQAKELAGFLRIERSQLEKFARDQGLEACPWLEVGGIRGGRPAGARGEKGLTSITLIVGWIALADPEGRLDVVTAPVAPGEALETPAAEPADELTGNGATEESREEDGADAHNEEGLPGVDLVPQAPLVMSTQTHVDDGGPFAGSMEVLGVPRTASGAASFVVHYSIENAKRWLLGRWLFPQERMPTRCWQWRIYKWTTLSYMLAGLALGFAALLVMYYGRGLSLKEYFQMAAVLATGWGVVWWRNEDSLTRLAEDRITMATEWWAGFDEPSQVEMIRTEGKTSHVQLVRYTANCSICGSKVEVLDGKREFPRRLVGRCTESPREHIFSFDRVTRTGFPLRRPPI